MELKRLLFILFFLLPTLCFAEADNYFYKETIVVAPLILDESSAYQDELGNKVYQELKLDLPFTTYYEQILTPDIDLKNLDNAGKKVTAKVHYSILDVGSELRLADETQKVEEFEGKVSNDDREIKEIEESPEKIEACPMAIEQKIGVNEALAIQKMRDEILGETLVDKEVIK